MKILIVGSGGREHALAWKVRQSSQVSTVYVAPGNAGTASESGISNIDIAVDNIAQLLAFAQEQHIDLTIVGPEVPLVLGIVDQFQAAGLRCFGPTAQAAQLEGSKAFSKAFMTRHNIPTAAFQTFTELDAAIAYIRTQGEPIVVKADGLAAGKGVVVAQTEEQAIAAVQDMLAGNSFGSAGHRVVIEEFLQGEEVSFIVIAAGLDALAMATSQDHKARDDGDLGPNTGGMGAYSPAPIITPSLHQRVMQEVIYPTLRGMQNDGNRYTGFLYAGLMITHDQQIKVLEYNCRFGDPETQPIMMRLQSDLVDLCLAALDNKLNSTESQWDARPALGVVLAASGYPDSYVKNIKLNRLTNHTNHNTSSKVFHAGTSLQTNTIISNGGRVLCACALGSDFKTAQQNAYTLCQEITEDELFYRKDIGYRAMK